MKATRIVSLALITFAAVGFNAHAQSADAGVDPAQNFVSTANASQVHADAVQANAARIQRGFSHDSGEYLSGTPEFMSTVTRALVRMDALKASHNVRVTEAG
jgi:hypothetical protein